MASRLEAFDGELKRITGGDPNVRPFVCEGSPLDCRIFIVGYNPATTDVSFWDFWELPHGFDKKRWLAAYESERQARGSPKRSSTRKRIELIVEAARPVRCLETNIYVTPAGSQRDLGLKDRSTHVFDFLLERIQPRVVFVHGTPAAEHVGRAFGLPAFKPPKYTWTSTLVGDTVLFAGSHLAYGWSFGKATRLGQELRAKSGA